MPRLARVVIPGCPHHVTQRGNNRQDVFLADDDRRAYLDILREQSRLYGLDLLGYCLMSNHVHLLAVPRREDSLAKAVGRSHWLYAQYLNRLHRRSGHLWQNRFYSCPTDEEHSLLALAYIERNPVRAKLVRQAGGYPWSSAAAHLHGRDSSDGLLHPESFGRLPPAEEWAGFLQLPEEPESLTRIRQSLNRGRPLANDSFISKVESTLGFRLRALPVGRPKKGEK